MPELPEVETIVRELDPHVRGQRLSQPRLFHHDVLRGVSARRLARALDGTRVVNLSRRAKHAVFLLETGHRMVIQPRMSGALLIYDRALTQEEARYAVLQVRVGRGSLLVYRDVRRLGTISLLNEGTWQAYTDRIGPEPLDEDFSVDRFAAQLRTSRQAAKKALMDQRKLAGVGNIYANEALFRARIDPSRPARDLLPEEIARLYRAVRGVLRGAIKAKGTTFRDYRTGTGERGAFQFALHAYGRGGRPCRRCGTRLVTTHAIDGRSTTFCWRCQGAHQ